MGLMLSPAAADHPQSTGPDEFSVVHMGGNEWWVEAVVPGDAGVAAVYARDDNSDAWTRLSLKSWGPWAGTFHIEPEHRVRFRVDMDTGARHFSCQFEHPTGLEQCNPQRSGHEFGERYVFDHLGGGVDALDIRVLGPAPEALSADQGGSVFACSELAPNACFRMEQTGPRTWFSSGPFPPGSRVMVDGTQGGDGSPTVHESCWFTHPVGLEKCDDGEGPGLLADFHSVKGNAWWVEVRVDSSKPITAVDARVNDAAGWVPLPATEWGSWASSFFVPDGSHIMFRAYSSGDEANPRSGDFAVSSPAWTWPDQLMVPSSTGQAVIFHDVRGDGGFVFVTTHTNTRVAGVVARELPEAVDHLMTLGDNGEWSVEAEIEPGQQVQFIATLEDGSTSIQRSSVVYDWPPT